MKVFIIAALLAVASAGPFGVPRTLLTEDTSGNYNLEFNTDTYARTEKRSQDGSILGSYSFIDPEGRTHTVTYVAAEDQGFVARGASLPVDNNPVPVPVQETSEVLLNRAEHFAIVQKERSLNPNSFVEERLVPAHEVLPLLTPPHIPTDHSDDVESQQAKAALIAAYHEALDRLASEYRRA